MNPTQAASLTSYLRMILSPFETPHVVKWSGWLLDALAVALKGAF